ncbi:MAG: TetR family transcriptional regulator C-terminal domain-containing protein [Granulosicoccus sp.]|nr:TetR family transcriptional regulator C-terminal domain-containing protein [Granulosicoccus sp.]
MVQPEKKSTRIQQQNRDRILTAALAIFSRYGYRGSTVDQIATEAGMSKANLLYYFRRKQDIYLAVLAETLEQWLDPLQMLDPAGDPIDELWRYTQTKLRLSRQAPAASRLFANEILQGAPMIKPFLANELKTLVTRKCGIIQDWIDQGKLADTRPIHLIFLIWAATQHYADFDAQISVLSDDDEDTLFSDAEATLKTILQSGLRPRPAQL